MYQANYYKPQDTSSNNKKNTTEFSKKRSGVLINESVYYLTKSKSKWVSVGFSLERKYNPVIKLGGNKNNQQVVFNEDQWISFLNNQGSMLNYIHSNSFGWNPMQGNGYEIHFVFVGDTRIIKITQCGENEIFLAGDTINEIANLADLVNYRFGILKNQEFSKYFNLLISGVASTNGDLIKNIYNIISPLQPPHTSNICCVLELLNIHQDIIIEDVETYACNEFVKSCIEK
jgi:hypothetical protein